MNLHNALRIQSSPESKGGTYFFKAGISESWCMGNIAQGGYAVGIALSAAIELQSRSLHPDPVHLTAHFLQPVDLAECAIHIKLLRSGKKFTNLEADLVQNGETKISTRMIFGVLPDLTELPSTYRDSLTLTPTSPHGRRIPLSRHPSLVTPDNPNDKYLYQTKAEDRFFEEQNAERAMRRSKSSEEQAETPDCGLEWGAWFELKDPEDVLEIAMIPFLADCMKNLPSLLPRELRPGPSWFATVVLTIEFKSRIPASIVNHNGPECPFSRRTVGIYSSARFMSEGRHDAYVEIWTAPSTIGSQSHTSSQGINPDWRDKQVCLAISTQMALTIPEAKLRRSRL